MSLQSTPAEAVTKAKRAISGLIGGAGRQQPINEEEQVLFDNQDTFSRSSDPFSGDILPGTAAGGGGDDGGSSSASSSDSSSSESSDDLRSRQSRKKPTAGAGGTVGLPTCWIWNLLATTVPPLPGPVRVRLGPPSLFKTLRTQTSTMETSSLRRRTLESLGRRSIART